MATRPVLTQAAAAAAAEPVPSQHLVSSRSLPTVAGPAAEVATRPAAPEARAEAERSTPTLPDTMETLEALRETKTMGGADKAGAPEVEAPTADPVEMATTEEQELVLEAELAAPGLAAAAAVVVAAAAMAGVAAENREGTAMGLEEGVGADRPV